MEIVRSRGRPKKAKEGDLLLALEKKKKSKEEDRNFMLRLVNRISNKKGKLSMSDMKYVHRPRSTKMFNVEKYGLRWNDAIIQQLKNQCHKPPSIGILALTELELLCGEAPQGGMIEEKLIDGLEYITASLVYANERYIDKITDGYMQYDMNGAYASILRDYPLPSTLNRIEDGVVYTDGENEIGVYVDERGNATFNYADMKLKITKTFIFNTFRYGKEFVDKWEKLKNNETYKKLAKDILVCSIGAMHKYRRNLIARYIWYVQKNKMLDWKNKIENMGGVVIKIHTDSIGYILAEPLNYSTDNKVLGEFKQEYIDKRIYLISAGQYQVEGKKPTLSGISWGGTFIETNEGERIHHSVFPCIKKGIVIKSYEKDGVDWKTLGAEIKFSKGEE